MYGAFDVDAEDLDAADALLAASRGHVDAGEDRLGALGRGGRQVGGGARRPRGTRRSSGTASSVASMKSNPSAPWMWRSMNPGQAVYPRPSIFFAPEGTVDPAGWIEARSRQ
jgi:hypothetical protein